MDFIDNYLSFVYHGRYHIAIIALVCIGVAFALRLSGDEYDG